MRLSPPTNWPPPFTRPRLRRTTRSSLRRRLAIAALAVTFLGWPVNSQAVEAPIADAAEKSNPAAIRTLLKQQADVNAPQADGMTALHWAAHRDDLATARLLTTARVGGTNRFGITPLSLACQNGNTAMVELLLERGVAGEKPF